MMRRAMMLALAVLCLAPLTHVAADAYARRFGRELRVPIDAHRLLVIYEGYPPGSMPGASQDGEVGLGVVLIDRDKPFRAAVHQGDKIAFITFGRGRTVWQWQRVEVARRGLLRRSATGEISFGS